MDKVKVSPIYDIVLGGSRTEVFGPVGKPSNRYATHPQVMYTGWLIHWSVSDSDKNQPVSRRSVK